VKRVQILAVGRLKERGLVEICADYYSRCRRTLKIEEREVRDLRALTKAVPARAQLVALDGRGEQLSSEAFASKLRGWIEGPQPSIAFAIGGADGLDDAVRQRADLVLSLGPMTFAHRLVRLLLAEQLYRAVSILEGSPYHRA
jgi:23S rRNA (pseudouridine1915-N3)-methyltransferase